MVEILTRKQAMEKLHISHTKMNRYLKDPEFPAVKDGVWYIFGERIEDYLMKKKTEQKMEPLRLLIEKEAK